MPSLRPVLVLALALGGCVIGDADPDESGDRSSLTPTYAPETTSAADGSAGSADTSANDPAAQPVAPAAAPVAPATDPAAPAPLVAQASITDPVGDLTLSPVDRPPAWADLAGATLRRDSAALELRVRLGGQPPGRAPDPDHTMNVAAFFDLDGDGSVDTEVWANLAAGGWGGAWFDDDSGAARFVDESGVAVAVEGPELVVRFPTGHVRDAATFRWSLASEWGRYAVIGAAGAARDDAPDGDVPVGFPQ